MIDPITALSVASAAVSQIKTLLNDGLDIGNALSNFAGAISDINYAEEKAKNPPIWKSFSSSAEKEALDAFIAKKKAQELRKEVETLISFRYGPKGLEDYKNTLREVRKQREERQYKKDKFKQTLIEVILGLVVFLAGITALIGFGYFLWLKQKGDI